uniref:NADH dehydrogenase [ubiquinone] 1 beta subcomplex subunit 11, mitochondrial n=1 Tax=Ciona intestinalis TaxID=7719 RepID=F6YS92_CIOIN|nr:uncharacterized protein LOC100185786 [Ciona intestinalis]|eukprot:XP_002128152.1 uncharacterized protein LOC100185786 [Ciona intestinalis]
MLSVVRCLGNRSLANAAGSICRSVVIPNKVVFGKHFISVALTRRNISQNSKLLKESTVVPAKTEYEIECERFFDKEKPETFLGFDRFDPLYDKVIAHVIMFFGFSVFLVFIPAMMIYGPDYRSRMIEWREYEAITLLEERQANGQPPIDPDFVPKDLIGTMVPEEGDWEQQWLRAQPAVTTDHRLEYYVQAPTW